MMATDASKMHLQGVKFEIDNGQLRMIATDAHRIIVASGELDGLLPTDVEVFVPAEGVEELAKLLPDEGAVGIAFDNVNLFFRVGQRVLTTRLLATMFPGYQMPFAQMGTYKHSCTFKADYLGDAIKRAMLCANRDEEKKRGSAAISMEFVPNKLKINAASAELGEANDVLDSNFTGGPLKLYCNGKFLLDYLGPAGDNEVKFEILDAESQMYLLSEKDGCSLYYCVMPMRG